MSTVLEPTNSATLSMETTAVTHEQRLAIGWSELAALGAVIALVVSIYRGTFVDLAKIWELDPNYSHGFAVLPLSLLFAVQAWRRHGPPMVSQTSRMSVGRGVLLMLVGLAIHFTARFVNHSLFDVASLVLVLRGALRVLGGDAAVRHYSFPIWFLLFMAVLPMAWYQAIAVQAQALVVSISAFTLDALFVPTYREGNFVRLAGQSLEVGAACSGIRQLIAVVALAVVVGHFSRRGPVFCWLLALLALPIAVAANCVRVVLTGLIHYWIGKEWAVGVFHTLEGLALVTLAAGLVIGCAYLLGRASDRIVARVGSKRRVA